MADEKMQQGWGGSLSQVIGKKQGGGFRNYLKSLIGLGREQATMTVSTTRQTYPEMDFASYISNVGQTVGKMKKQLSNKQSSKKKRPVVEVSVEQTVKSVPTTYFQKDRGLQMGKLSNRSDMRKQQQKLADYLDIVDVCLFRQINAKFSDFFSILDNIQYLENAVNTNIVILAQARKSLSIIQTSCVKKVASIKKQHIVLANRKKLQAMIVLMKEVRDSLQYASVQQTNETMAALCSAKSSYHSIKQIKSVKRIGQWLDQTTNHISQSFSKNVYIRLMQYVIEPLRQDIMKMFRQIPEDGNNNVQQTFLLNETRLEPQRDIIMAVDTRVQKETGKILGQMHKSLGIREVQEVWSEFIRGLQHLYTKFLQDLRTYLASIVSKEKQQILVENNTVGNDLPLEQLIDKVPLAYFSRLLLVFHNFLTTSLLRYYGLLSHFLQEILKQGINQPQLFTWMAECASELIDKMKHRAYCLISLRRMSDDTILMQFHSHLQQNMVWEDCLKKILEMRLFSQQFCDASEKVEKLKAKVKDILQSFINSKKSQQLSFINNIHNIVVEQQLRQSLKDQTWTAVNNIPFHYMPTIYYILFGDTNQTVLNDSVMDRSRREMSILVDSKRKADSYRGNDFKLLKNAVIINKKAYRVTVCALLFSQIIEEYLKIQDLYPEFKQQISKKIQEVISVYNEVSYEMIVMAGALKLDKIKAKIITARHLCLSWSCLQFIMTLLEKHENTSRKTLEAHSAEIKKRLSTLIKGKINMEMQNLLKSQLSNHPCPVVQTVNIVSSYRQMLEIMQDHMPQTVCREVMKDSVDTMVNMVRELKKSPRGAEQAAFFIGDMKVLEQMFPDELSQMKCL